MIKAAEGDGPPGDVFCPRRPSGRKKLMNVCTTQVPSKVKFSNQQSVLATLFKHGLPKSSSTDFQSPSTSLPVGTLK